MRLINKHIDKNKSGKITLLPENDEDMWIAYNLIQPDDTIRASTVRKVQNESSTGTVNTKQVRTNLTIAVEATDFDGYGSQLIVKGRNVQENEYVKMGAYHSISIIPNTKFSLIKNEWDSIAMDLVEQCTDVSNQADLAAIVMHNGLAHICLITTNSTVLRAKVEVNIPQKRKGYTSYHDKAIDKFIDQVTQAIIRHIKFDVVKCVIIASPGFLNEKLLENIKKTAVKDEIKVLQENINKFILVHSSTGHMHSLKEVLLDPLVQSQAADTKASTEVRSLEEFYKLLNNDPGKAFYGVKHVDYAHENGAIDTLLISDSLFRCKDHLMRRKYVNMVDAIKDNGGKVRIFSSNHISGQQLNNLSGLAAMLRFPLDEPPSDDEEEDDDNSNDGNQTDNNIIN